MTVLAEGTPVHFAPDLGYSRESVVTVYCGVVFPGLPKEVDDHPFTDSIGEGWEEDEPGEPPTNFTPEVWTSTLSLLPLVTCPTCKMVAAFRGGK